jgi:hypothetical protein
VSHFIFIYILLVWLTIVNKIKVIESGNRAYNTLSIVGDFFHNDLSRELLRAYKYDQRHTDSPDGPGPSVGQFIRWDYPDL